MPINKEILVIGDSISAAYGIAIKDGWVQLIQQTLSRHTLAFSITNQSVNGETSYGGLARITPLLEQHQPALVILELGANDALNGSLPEVIKDNLRELIACSQNAGAKVLLLAIQTSNAYGDAYRDEFYQMYLTLAEEMECTWVPNILQEISNTEKMLQNDGLHPTAKAQPIIAKKIYPYLLTMIETI